MRTFGRADATLSHWCRRECFNGLWSHPATGGALHEAENGDSVSDAQAQYRSYGLLFLAVRRGH